jgi:hypothetical protein
MSDDIVKFEGQNELLKEKLQMASENGHVQCAAAMGIAKTLGVPSREVGKVADHLNLKICKCQLSCF